MYTAINIASVIMLSGGLLAAPVGLILGSVRDQSGAAVAGVRVTILNTATNQTRETKTDDRGGFVVTALPVGPYAVNVTFTGFKQSSLSNIVLQVDQQARVDVSLEVGDASMKVQVTDAPPLLGTDTSSIGQVIVNRQITDLPLNGRNFTQLAALTPGALTTQTTGVSGALTGATTVQVSGGQSSKTEFLIDGVSSQEQGLDGAQFLPSVDAVGEFKVQSNSFSAEYGRGTAIINATIKSGTNEVHGVLFEFLRNEKLDSRNFFAASRGILKQNQFGGSAGGPIIKNRLFYFGNYEGMQLRRGLARNTLVPTVAQRSGDFSGQAAAVRDPLAQAPFPGNRIPASALSPTTSYLMGFVPAPNNSAGTYRYNASQAVTANQGNGRLDYQATAKDMLFFRYSRNVGQDYTPGPLPDSGGIDLASRAHNAGFGYTRIFRPELLNEIRVGYTHLYTSAVPQGAGVNHTALAGIRGFEQTSLEFPGFPIITVTGFGTLVTTRAYRPAIAPFETRQFADNATWIKGRHTMKFGFDYRRFHYAEANAGTASRGSFNYGGGYTGNGYADFALGFPVTGSRSYPANQFGLADRQYHFFAQDDFKVGSRLTLNLGLRYERNTIPVADLAQSSVFDLDRGKIIVSTLPNGKINLFTQQVAGIVYPFYASRIQTAAEAGYPNNLQETSGKQAAPRIGLAYRPFDNNRTVIRAGYGVFYVLQRGNTAASYQVLNPPFTVDETKNNSATIPALNTVNFFDAPFAIGTPRITTANRLLRAPYAQQWNFAVQREVLPTLVLEAAYVANKGSRLEQRNPINYVPPGAGNVQARRPFPDYSSGVRYENGGSSSYHSLQTKVEKRLSAGLSLLAAYTWSKLIDNANINSYGTGAGNVVQDPRNLALERGPGAFDVTQRLVTSFSYELPFGRNQRFGAGAPKFAQRLIGGWQLGGIVQFQSGFPFTPALGTPDPANVGREYARRPDRIGSGKLDNRTVDRYFDTAAFRTPAAFTIGNSGRNILRGPGIANWDMSAIKNTAITERTSMQFRWEMFNALNRPQFFSPDTNVDAGGPGGRILSARDPRIMQFALKLYF